MIKRGRKPFFGLPSLFLVARHPENLPMAAFLGYHHFPSIQKAVFLVDYFQILFIIHPDFYHPVIKCVMVLSPLFHKIFTNCHIRRFIVHGNRHLGRYCLNPFFRIRSIFAMVISFYQIALQLLDVYKRQNQ